MSLDIDYSMPFTFTSKLRELYPILYVQRVHVLYNGPDVNSSASETGLYHPPLLPKFLATPMPGIGKFVCEADEC